MGRTGTLWAYEQTPVPPDVITAAKALGGGLPVGACVTAPEVGDVLTLGEHGSTFAGGPICARGRAGRARGARRPGGPRQRRARAPSSCTAELEGIRRHRHPRARADGRPRARRRRGRRGRRRAALAGGLVVNVPGRGMLRFLPPLVVGEDDVETALERDARCPRLRGHRRLPDPRRVLVRARAGSRVETPFVPPAPGDDEAEDGGGGGGLDRRAIALIVGLGPGARPRRGGRLPGRRRARSR